jgi:hypothetical protein
VSDLYEKWTNGSNDVKYDIAHCDLDVWIENGRLTISNHKQYDSLQEVQMNDRQHQEALLLILADALGYEIVAATNDIPYCDVCGDVVVAHAIYGYNGGVFHSSCADFMES